MVDPTLSWQGYVDGGSTPTTVAMTDYYDCDGTKGINAVLLDESAGNCPSCENEETAIEDAGAGWKAAGVQMITLLAEDEEPTTITPATLETALTWQSSYPVPTSSAVCSDPNWTTKLWGGASSSGNGFPTNFVIDPRTMTIVQVIAGAPPELVGTVANLAVSNSP